MRIWVNIGCLVLGALATSVVLSCSGEFGGEATPGSAGQGAGGSSGSGGSSASGGSGGNATGGASGSGASGTSGGSGAGGESGTGGNANGNSTEPNLKVAFVGDQGAGTKARAVYKVILDEGAALAVVLGDFDYKDDPNLWESDIDAVLGPDYPLFGLVGNHDKVAWSGYKEKLTKRLSKISDASCEGSIGEQHNCTFRGLRLILSGIGTLGVRAEHETFIEDALAADPNSLWKFCGWHQNQTDMQLGTKGNAIGWKAFQSCQKHGAIIGMGHEHTYGRTLTLTDVGNAAAGHGATGAPDTMDVALGSTFAFYNGLGGASMRAYSVAHDSDTWWATQYCTDKYVKNGEAMTGGSKHGALFIVFNVDGDPSKARGYFKNVAGEIIDEFTIWRN
jgi:hypothetical protein